MQIKKILLRQFRISGKFVGLLSIIILVFLFQIKIPVYANQKSQIDSLKSIIQQKPTPEACFELGMIYLNHSNYEEAYNQFVKCNQIEPQSPFAYRARTKIGYIFYRQNKFDAASTELEKVLFAKPDLKQAQRYQKLTNWMREGREALNQNSFELATNHFHKVLAQDSMNLTARENLNTAQKRLQAEKYIEQAEIALKYNQIQDTQLFLAKAESLWAEHPNLNQLKENLTDKLASLPEKSLQKPEDSGQKADFTQKITTYDSLIKPRPQTLKNSIADLSDSTLDSIAFSPTDSAQSVSTANQKSTHKVEKDVLFYGFLVLIVISLIIFWNRKSRKQRPLKSQTSEKIATEFSPATYQLRHLKIGDKIGKYEIIEKLQKGGMGQVLKARHPHFRKPVVIKSILPELMHDKQVRQRLIREANILFELDHPNIVRVTDLIEEYEQIYIVLQYVEGHNLKEFITQSGPLAPTIAIPLFIQACDALAYLHQKEIIHRDIKPQNMMLEKETQILKLVDFGIVKPYGADLEQALTSASRIAGTPNYMSPEQLLNDELDSRSDIFSLGISLFEVLTGIHPFESQGNSVIKAILSLPPQPIPDPKSPFMPELEKICLKMMAKDRNDRYDSDQAVSQHLKNVLVLIK